MCDPPSQCLIINNHQECYCFKFLLLIGRLSSLLSQPPNLPSFCHYFKSLNPKDDIRWYHLTARKRGVLILRSFSWSHYVYIAGSTSYNSCLLARTLCYHFQSFIISRNFYFRWFALKHSNLLSIEFRKSERNPWKLR